MVWFSGDGYTLAPALLTLFHQLQAAYPGQQWQNNAQTGTIGDAAHRNEGSASDHNPWLDNTVRALDVAGFNPGVVTDGPDCEALFAMVNQMYAARDPRVFPNGYAIYKNRITDWNNPGGFHAQDGDPHLLHCHISVSQNPAGFNSTAPWPLPGESTLSNGATQIGDEDMPLTDADVAKVVAALRPSIVNASVAAQNKTQAVATALGNQINTNTQSTVTAVKTILGPTIDRTSHMYGVLEQIASELSAVGTKTGTAVDLAPVIAKIDALSKHLGA